MSPKNRFDAIKMRWETVPAGVWTNCGNWLIYAGDSRKNVIVQQDESLWTMEDGVGDFIAQAHQDIPYLMAEVERLRADNDRLKAYLRGDDKTIETATALLNGVSADTLKWKRRAEAMERAMSKSCRYCTHAILDEVDGWILACRYRGEAACCEADKWQFDEARFSQETAAENGNKD